MRKQILSVIVFTPAIPFIVSSTSHFLHSNHVLPFASTMVLCGNYNRNSRIRSFCVSPQHPWLHSHLRLRITLHKRSQLRSPTSDEGWQLRHVHGRNRSGEEDTNECTGACRTWRLSEEGSQSSTWIIDDLQKIKARDERRTYPLSTLVKDCCQVCLPRFAAKTWVKDPTSLRHAASQVACTSPTCQHSGNTYSCIEMQTG